MLKTFVIPTPDGDMIVQSDTADDNYLPSPEAKLLDHEEAEKLLSGKRLADIAVQFEQSKSRS